MNALVQQFEGLDLHSPAVDMGLEASERGLDGWSF